MDIDTIEFIDAVNLHKALDGLSANTKRAYKTHIRRFYAKYQSLDRPSVLDYCRTFPASPPVYNQRLSALKFMAANLPYLDSTVRKEIESIPGRKTAGKKIGRWLTKDEAVVLLKAPETEKVLYIKYRDLALLGVLVGAGLRREELTKLEWWQYQYRESRPILVDIQGKGGKVRSVPIPDWVAGRLDRLKEYQGGRYHKDNISGSERIFRSMGRSMLSVSGVREIVRVYSKRIGHEVAPHDLRRTFAYLARSGGADLEAIRDSLGHSTVRTTEIYLRSDISRGKAAADRLGIEL